jgi:DNA-binding XRE family transcriptional regulator
MSLVRSTTGHQYAMLEKGVRCLSAARALQGGFTRGTGTVPNAVVNAAFDRGVSPMAAWREHLRVTQAEVAGRIGITQAAYAQMERAKRPRKATLEKVAAALGLEAEQLRW